MNTEGSPGGRALSARAVEDLKRLLETMPRVRLAVLFGSAAAGTERPDSDIDVGVMLDDDAFADRLAVDLERAAGRPVDVLRLASAPPLLRFEIARHGIVLVEREPFAWAEFRAHAMIDWWDWAPTARMMHRVMSARLREEADRGPA
jgi:predicted nucleotidyltransferase